MTTTKYLAFLICISWAQFGISADRVYKAAPQATLNKWEFSGYLGSLSIDEESAAREFIDSQALVVGFSADYDSNLLLTSMNLEWVRYDDNASFSQITEDNFGNVESSSSSASGILLSVATGPKYQVGQANNAIVYGQAGIAGMFGSERSIDNCSNCLTEKIDIEGGAFLKLGFVANVSHSFAIGGHTVQYVGSKDLEASYSIVLSSSF